MQLHEKEAKTLLDIIGLHLHVKGHFCAHKIRHIHRTCQLNLSLSLTATEGPILSLSPDDNFTWTDAATLADCQSACDTSASCQYFGFVTGQCVTSPREFVALRGSPGLIETGTRSV